MMFGNVAPAPLSWTCAAAGTAAPSRAARAKQRVDFMSVCSPLYALERELRLEIRLRPRRLECRSRRAALVREHIQVCEQAEVRRKLIRGAADEARQAVVADVCIWIRQVHAREQRRLRVGEMVYSEHAGHRARILDAGRDTISRDRVFPGERDLFGPI